MNAEKVTEGSITLRQIEERDLDILREMLNDPKIEYSTIGWSFPISSVSQVKWFNEVLLNEKSTIRRMIEIDDKYTIGCIILNQIDWENKTGEIGVKILRKYQGKKYTVDALKLFITYCFNNLDIHCIYGSCLALNVATIRLTRAMGFSIEGVQRSAVFKNGKRHDLVHFSRENSLKEE